MKKIFAILLLVALSTSMSFAKKKNYDDCPPGGGQGDECYTVGITEAEAECSITLGVNLPDLTAECAGEVECVSGNPGETVDVDTDIDFNVEGALGYDVDYSWATSGDLTDDDANTITVNGSGETGGTLSTDTDSDGLGEDTATYTINSFTIPAGMMYGEYEYTVTLTAEYDL